MDPDEPVYLPGGGLRIHVAAPVDEQAAGGDGRTGRKCVSGDRHRSAEAPQAAERYGRMQAQRLGDRGFGEPGLAVRQPGLRARFPCQLRQRPAECCRGRLVARDEEGHELIAQLAVRETRTVLVSYLEEQREDVGPVREVGRVAASGDLSE